MPLDGPHEIAGHDRRSARRRRRRALPRRHRRARRGGHAGPSRCATASSPARSRRRDFGSLNESLRIGPIAYVHVRAGREQREGRSSTTSRFAGATTRRARSLADPREARRALRDRRGDRHRQRVQPRAPERRLAGRGAQPAAVPAARSSKTRVPPTIAARRRASVRRAGAAAHAARARDASSFAAACRSSSTRGIRSDGNRPEPPARPVRARLPGAARDGSPAPGFEAPARHDRVRSARRRAGRRRGSSTRPAAAFRSTAAAAHAVSLHRDEHVPGRRGVGGRLGHARACRRATTSCACGPPTSRQRGDREPGRAGDNCAMSDDLAALSAVDLIHLYRTSARLARGGDARRASSGSTRSIRSSTRSASSTPTALATAARVRSALDERRAAGSARRRAGVDQGPPADQGLADAARLADASIRPGRGTTTRRRSRGCARAARCCSARPRRRSSAGRA